MKVDKLKKMKGLNEQTSRSVCTLPSSCPGSHRRTGSRPRSRRRGTSGCAAQPR